MEKSKTKEFKISINLIYVLIGIYVLSLLFGYRGPVLGLAVIFHVIIASLGALFVAISMFAARNNPVRFLQKLEEAGGEISHEQMSVIFEAPKILHLVKVMIPPMLVGLLGYHGQAIYLSAVVLILFGLRSTYKVRELREQR